MKELFSFAKEEPFFFFLIALMGFGLIGSCIGSCSCSVDTTRTPAIQLKIGKQEPKAP